MPPRIPSLSRSTDTEIHAEEEILISASNDSNEMWIVELDEALAPRLGAGHDH